MYIDKIYCENMGPIAKVTISSTFSENGNPKPIVLVGKNGSGKTMLLSSVVDALHELGGKAFQDVTKKKQGGGYKYFKITSPQHIKIGTSRLLSYVSFSGRADQKLEYLYCQGDIEPTACKAEIEQNVQVTLNLSLPAEGGKTATVDKNLIEKLFSTTALCYFPAYRYAIPSWIGQDYIEGRKVDPYRRQYSGELSRSIIVDNARYETPIWIEDVVIDARAELAFDPNGIRTTSNVNDLRALSAARENVEKILSAILERQVVVKLGYRLDHESRLAICENGSNIPIVPSFDALSTGQTVLIELFITILRYADAIDINKSIDLSKIEGIVVIDEIDAHLHVDLLYDVLPRVMALFPKVQFIVTAHSPMFILGMEKCYGAGGFDLYELPSGERIEAESYNEFKLALARIEDTKAAQKEIARCVEVAAAQIRGSSTWAEDALVVITEGYSDWKHLERAWSELKGNYPELDGKLSFLHYHPSGKGNGEPEFEMGDSQLVEMCKQFAKIEQRNRFVFLADADNPKVTKDLIATGSAYKDWGHNVFSFQLPDPGLRTNFPSVCIEHYYSDQALKTPVEVSGAQRRLFLSGEFNRKTGRSADHQFFYENHKNIKEDKPFAIIEDCVYKCDDVSETPVNYALPKNDFATEILNRNPVFDAIEFDTFRKIFDVLRIIPERENNGMGMSL